MNASRPARLCFVLSMAACAVIVACGGSDDAVTGAPPDGGAADSGPRGPEQTGQECTTATACYGGVAEAGADAGGIRGEVVCLTKVPNGYCTHKCNDDADCCAAPGECRTGLKQVCAPLENQPDKYCFLSCEDADVTAGIASQAADGGYDGGATDGGSREDAYCHAFASTGLKCRSTGGGKNNRKVCLP